MASAAPTTMQRVRAWQGPALLSYGFRPFFLFATLYAAFSIAVWVPWYLGFISLPSLFPPVVWHSHELLFGYVPAVVAGFLLTAVPNWTGRLPVVGWPLAGLVSVWLAGRVAVSVSNSLGPGLTALATLAFLAVLIAVIGREIAAGKNKRNFKVLGVVAVLLVAQALFQWEVWRYGYSVYGWRLAIATVLTLIMLIGGRVIPSFTTNWLKRRGVHRLPVPFSRFDGVAILVSVIALAGWAFVEALPIDPGFLGGLLLVAAVFQIVRLARWQPHLTLAEPLVTILHIGYLFVPLGFLLAGIALVTGDPAHETGAVHAWTAGAVGTMTLAVMTRATLGHTGRPLTASWPTIAIYICVVSATLARIIVALYPQWTMILMPAAGLAWVLAFAGFAVFYGPLLLRRAG